jgi:adenine-specific DNA-methyltransferase
LRTDSLIPENWQVIKEVRGSILSDKNIYVRPRYTGGAFLLVVVEQTRLRVSKNTEAKRKSQLGQFLTPARTAQFMAGLFTYTDVSHCRLLDAGAGIGSLTSAFLERCVEGDLKFEKVEVTAFELDSLIHKELNDALTSYKKSLSLDYEILGGDFIEQAVNRIQFGIAKGFTHAILNPPYKKISSDSHHRLLLRQADIETVNLYSAFVALALAMMAPSGQIVATFRVVFVTGRITGHSATLCWSVLQSGTCTCSTRAAKLSRMTMCSKKTLSFC